MIALLVILAPLLAALSMLIGPAPGSRRFLLCPLAALPALAYALFGDPDGSRAFGWLILDTHLGLAFRGPPFLFFTASLWFIAGWYAVGYVKREKIGPFAVFWLLTLAGNLGVVLAGDVPAFYTFFALMTFAAYGLVVSERTAEGWRAGRIYILLAMVGEAMLIGAFMLAVAGAESFLLADASAAVAESPYRNLIILLTVAGFGVKAGVVPLHFWLPLAHPVAPTPASAVLSGVMIKAGLIGWMHLLPGGHGAFPGWSVALISVGLVTAFYAVVCGLPQRNMKTVLAYSSVSQMGILLLVVGAALAEPEAWKPAMVVLAVYALNHAFAKGTLFLGVGICERSVGASRRRRRIVLAGLALPALAIAGAPLMGGAIAKDAVKLATEIPAGTAPWLKVLLPLSAVATTLILGRFLWLAQRRMEEKGERHASAEALWWPWVAGLVGTLGGVYFAVPWYALELRTAESTWLGVWENIWPIGAGTVLLFVTRYVPESLKAPLRIPAGDVVVGFERLVGRVGPRVGKLIGPERWRIDLHPWVESLGRSDLVNTIVGGGEVFFRRKETAGFFMVLLVLVVWFLLS